MLDEPYIVKKHWLLVIIKGGNRDSTFFILFSIVFTRVTALCLRFTLCGLDPLTGNDKTLFPLSK
jgi:hypothetical protein